MKKYEILPIEKMTEFSGKKNQQLSVLKNNSICKVSPLAILMGADQRDGYGGIWSSSLASRGFLRVVNIFGQPDVDYHRICHNGLRFASDCSPESDIAMNAMSGMITTDDELPLDPVQIVTEDTLAEKLQSNEWQEIDKSYPFDMREYWKTDEFEDIETVKSYVDASGVSFSLVPAGWDCHIPGFGDVSKGQFVRLNIVKVPGLYDAPTKTIIHEQAHLSGIRGYHLDRYIKEHVNVPNGILSPIDSKPKLNTVNDSLAHNAVLVAFVELARLYDEMVVAYQEYALVRSEQANRSMWSLIDPFDMTLFGRNSTLEEQFKVSETQTAFLNKKQEYSKYYENLKAEFTEEQLSGMMAMIESYSEIDRTIPPLKRTLENKTN